MPVEVSDSAIREDAIAWLARLRGIPTDADKNAFEAWYASNPRHADIYDALLNAWERTAPDASLPSDPVLTASDQKRWVNWALATAAAVLLILLGTVAVGHLPPVKAPPSTMLASGRGEIRTIVLEDGSRLTLDTETALQTEFTQDRRAIRLDKGRVRFEVATDARPFIVTANQSEVAALGTVFDVDRRDAATVVTLLEGVVDVRYPGNADYRRPSNRLKPGEKIEVAANPSEDGAVVMPAEDTRWPSGMLSFDNERVADVVAAANRYATTRILISEPADGNRLFTGTIKAGNQDQIAHAIAKMFDLGISRDQSNNIVLAPRT